MNSAEYERRKAQAETRHRYRSTNRRVPYVPRERGVRLTKMTFGLRPDQVTGMRAAAADAGLPLAMWVREVVDDVLRARQVDVT